MSLKERCEILLRRCLSSKSSRKPPGTFKFLKWIFQPTPGACFIKAWRELSWRETRLIAPCCESLSIWVNWQPNFALFKLQAAAVILLVINNSPLWKRNLSHEFIIRSLEIPTVLLHKCKPLEGDKLIGWGKELWDSWKQTFFKNYIKFASLEHRTRRLLGLGSTEVVSFLFSSEDALCEKSYVDGLYIYAHLWICTRQL